jgi:hypothetical protein
MIVPEPDDFRERAAIVARGFDPADFTDRDERAFRLYYQADDLFDQTAVLDETGLADALQ